MRAGTTLAAQVLDNLQVDPDGYIRVAARYRPIGQTRAQNGLLALPAIREFGLANGYSFEARGADLPEWQTVVAGAPAATAGGLQTGDILVRETVSGTEMIAADSLDTALNALVSENKPEARVVVLRNGAETTAVMPLAQE